MMGRYTFGKERIQTGNRQQSDLSVTHNALLYLLFKNDLNKICQKMLTAFNSWVVGSWILDKCYLYFSRVLNSQGKTAQKGGCTLVNEGCMLPDIRSSYIRKQERETPPSVQESLTSMKSMEASKTDVYARRQSR